MAERPITHKHNRPLEFVWLKDIWRFGYWFAKLFVGYMRMELRCPFIWSVLSGCCYLFLFYFFLFFCVFHWIYWYVHIRQSTVTFLLLSHIHSMAFCMWNVHSVYIFNYERYVEIVYATIHTKYIYRRKKRERKREDKKTQWIYRTKLIFTNLIDLFNWFAGSCSICIYLAVIKMCVFVRWMPKNAKPNWIWELIR